MSDRVQFILDPVDNLTAPARRAPQSTQSPERALSRVHVAAESADRAFPRLVARLTEARSGA
jgi:hypothetical protein